MVGCIIDGITFFLSPLFPIGGGQNGVTPCDKTRGCPAFFPIKD